MSARSIFGFVPSALDEAAVARLLLAPSARGTGPHLVVTPNLDHIVQLQHNQAFRAAYDHAALTLCDGFPVHYYARLRGHPAHRVTGSGLIARLLGDGGLNAEQRPVFVCDRAKTAAATMRWAEARGCADSVATIVPPLGFIDDPAACATLVAAIAAHRPGLIVMGVGAPRSEIFIDRSRAALPDCWALCVGQGLAMAIGLVTRAPPAIRALHGEWLWRLAREPRRLGPRYGIGAFRFARALVRDLR